MILQRVAEGGNAVWSYQLNGLLRATPKLFLSK